MLYELFHDFYTNFYAPGGQFIDVTINYGLLLTFVLGLYFLKSQIFPLTNALKTVLGPMGISNQQCVWALMLCWKRHYTHEYIRIFIETACIESKGCCQNRKWWSNKCRRFPLQLDEYKKNSKNLYIKVENCFNLTSDDFSNAVERYFKMLKDSRFIQKFLVSDTDKTPSFLINLHISDGYLAPMSFISGLTKRFEQDWEKILTNYYATLESAELGNGHRPGGGRQAILPEELYFSYNWLMWGPSFQVSAREESDRQKLILYGYGDESNSINVIVDGNHRAWKTLNKQDGFGLPGAITGRLIDTSLYDSYHYNDIEEESRPFFSRLSQRTLNIPFALKLHDFSIRQSHRANQPHPTPETKYFFSAYIWIMFMLDSGDDKFSPERSVTFFEHANISNKDNYNFLIECLIAKVLLYFEQIADTPDDIYRHRKYRYCISMNREIEERFIKELNNRIATGGKSGEWLRENLVIDTQAFNISTILNAFDNYFIKLNIRELDYSSMEDRTKLGYFYVNTYFPSYSQYAGSQTLERILKKLQKKERNKHNIRYHLLCATNENNEIVGLVSFYFVNAEMNGVIEDLIVNTDNKGIRRKLLSEAIDYIEYDAQRNGGHPAFILFRALAYCGTPAERNKAIARWRSQGFVPRSEEPNEIWLIRRSPTSADAGAPVDDRYQEHQQMLITED